MLYDNVRYDIPASSKNDKLAAAGPAGKTADAGYAPAGALQEASVTAYTQS